MRKLVLFLSLLVCLYWRADAAVALTVSNNEAFVAQAVLGNLAEVELAKAALGKTKDPRIQNFAQRMIVDNTNAVKELTQLAQDTAIDVPYQLDIAHRDLVDGLNSLFDADFDTAFSEHMYMVQTRTVSLFTSAVHDTSLQGVLRLYAIKMLSTLQHHRLDAVDLINKYSGDSQAALRM